jgi:hypothetical protein
VNAIVSAATVDLPLLKAVAWAHRWFDELSFGKASSLAERAVTRSGGYRFAVTRWRSGLDSNSRYPDETLLHLEMASLKGLLILRVSISSGKCD